MSPDVVENVQGISGHLIGQGISKSAEEVDPLLEQDVSGRFLRRCRDVPVQILPGLLSRPPPKQPVDLSLCRDMKEQRGEFGLLAGMGGERTDEDDGFSGTEGVHADERKIQGIKPPGDVSLPQTL